MQSVNNTYYESNAEQFFSETESVDMSGIREVFLKYIPAGGAIRDWGCGSGRDTLAFIEAGYQVDASDASEKLCELASEKTGIRVMCETFDEMKAENQYDGIWACASLLHVEKDRIPEMIHIAREALKSGGVIYISFKYGEFEGMRNGRFFTDMTEERFAEILNHIKGMNRIEQWITGDVREGREDGRWLNLILRKKDIN